MQTGGFAFGEISTKSRSSLFANSIPRSGLTKPMFSPCDPINRISLESIELFILIPCSLETWGFSLGLLTMINSPLY